MRRLRGFVRHFSVGAESGNVYSTGEDPPVGVVGIQAFADNPPAGIDLGNVSLNSAEWPIPAPAEIPPHFDYGQGYASRRPSTSRGTPRGLSPRSASGRRCWGKPWYATGRRKRSIAAVPTEVLAAAVVAGYGPP